ncbi:MAG: radical SAM protein [Elusimicrobia bacterium]|nr:radical SAM protein [Elusimicrobiota bacterium]
MTAVFEENLRLNKEETARGALELRSRPLNLLFTANTFCNLECIMCSRANKPGQLSAAAVEKLSALFPYLRDLNIQGGEPLLVPWLDDCLERAARFPDMRKYVNTNGLLIDAKRADLFALAEVFLIWSIDSPRRDTYEYIRRGARYEQLLSALAAIKEANKKAGRAPRKELNAVVMRSNAGHIEEFLPFAVEHQFEVINFAPILFNEKSDEDIFTHGTPQELQALRDAIARTAQAADRAGIRVQSSVPGTVFTLRPWDEHKQPPAPEQRVKPAIPAPAPVLCRMPWRQLFVDLLREDHVNPKNVFPECFCPHPLGNIEHDSIEELWNGPAMQAYRRKLLEGDVSAQCNPACLQRLSRQRFQ